MNSTHDIDFLGIKLTTGSQLASTILLIVFAISFIVSAFWICRDARLRNKDPFLAFIFLSAAGWPFSLLWWLWLRPFTQKEREEEAAKNVSGDCPKCGTFLSGKQECPNCHWNSKQT
jgi:hypothetical protein